MQKQNIFINDRWLALMHGLFINPMTNRGKELTLSPGHLIQNWSNITSLIWWAAGKLGRTAN